MNTNFAKLATSQPLWINLCELVREGGCSGPTSITVNRLRLIVVKKIRLEEGAFRPLNERLPLFLSPFERGSNNA
jgi:hypothetical protein